MRIQLLTEHLTLLLDNIPDDIATGINHFTGVLPIRVLSGSLSISLLRETDLGPDTVFSLDQCDPRHRLRTTKY